jgi:hypothetical protein
MTYLKKYTCLFLALLLQSVALSNVSAQDDDSWRDKLSLLKYSPRYFGPNAFPLPELRADGLGKRFEVEMRGEYHYFTGDRTKDIFTRIYVPVADGRAGFELSLVAYEYYNTTQEIVEERNAAGRYWKGGAKGDVVFNSYYSLLKDSHVADITLEAAFKTASGNRLADARYTDAGAYWFDVNLGRSLYKSADDEYNISVQGLLGFYCWMTNDMVHRQNDAVVYSGGISAKLKSFSLSADVAGLYGYENNGDRPLQIRTKLNYEYSKNILSLRYRQGMNDFLYNSLSLSYIRCF